MECINKNILLSGEIIGKQWKVAEKIGEGTFSQIYAAVDIQTGKRVAIKVEAPSSLKPVLEWESSILKALQDCHHVCRYHYHGKHAESTVLVMELLGDSMSMLRMSPEASNGLSVGKCVSVGIEMLDCIEAFHAHGYVHRDIKASNFASNLTNNPAKKKYRIIDFGLSRQYMSEGKVIPPREKAEFRGTSMYASLSAHRKQELGPKDDMWSWLYLLLDFLRGELPWAFDAQQKNRAIVLGLKEYYSIKNPELLVDTLPGAPFLLSIVKYLSSLKYEDSVDYDSIRITLSRLCSGRETAEVDVFDAWEAIKCSQKRALLWESKANEAIARKDPIAVFENLLSVAKKYATFFNCEGLSQEQFMQVQQKIFDVEKLIIGMRLTSPPPVQSFLKRRQSEQKLRGEAQRKRKEREWKIRSDIGAQIGKVAQEEGNTLLAGMNKTGIGNTSTRQSNNDSSNTRQENQQQNSTRTVQETEQNLLPKDSDSIEEPNQTDSSKQSRLPLTRSISNTQIGFHSRSRPRLRRRNSLRSSSRCPSHFRSTDRPQSTKSSRSKSRSRSRSFSRSNSRHRRHRSRHQGTLRHDTPRRDSRWHPAPRE